MAVDARTGKQRWKVGRPHVISGYSTPTVYRPKSGGAELFIPESFQLTVILGRDRREALVGARARL